MVCTFVAGSPKFWHKDLKVGEREREREKLIQRRWLLVEHNHTHKSPIAKKKKTVLITKGKEHGRIWHQNSLPVCIFMPLFVHLISWITTDQPPAAKKSLSSHENHHLK
jgi:hypothetical protein